MTPTSAPPPTLSTLPTYAELLTAEQVAKLIRVDPKTVRTWTSQHRLRGYRVGRAYRYAPAAVQAFLDECATGGPRGEPPPDPDELAAAKLRHPAGRKLRP